jgi:hypothetical protein
VNVNFPFWSKDLNTTQFAHKLMGSVAPYGLDVAFADAPSVDEKRMSAWIPFADGNRRDRVGDLLEVEGIDTSDHRFNPIILLDHGKNYQLPVALAEDPDTRQYTCVIDPIGKVAKDNCFFYQGRGMKGVDKDKESAHALMCEQLFDLLRKRYIRAGSIGYIVKNARPMPPDPHTGQAKGHHLLQVKKLEASVVVLPANADTTLKDSAPSAKSILCGGNVCGKPLSPYLIKSLQPFDTDTKVQLGYTGKSLPKGTKPGTLPRGGDHTATDMPPPDSRQSWLESDVTPEDLPVTTDLTKTDKNLGRRVLAVERGGNAPILRNPERPKKPIASAGDYRTPKAPIPLKPGQKPKGPIGQATPNPATSTVRDYATSPPPVRRKDGDAIVGGQGWLEEEQAEHAEHADKFLGIRKQYRLGGGDGRVIVSGHTRAPRKGKVETKETKSFGDTLMAKDIRPKGKEEEVVEEEVVEESPDDAGTDLGADPDQPPDNPGEVLDEEGIGQELGEEISDDVMKQHSPYANPDDGAGGGMGEAPAEPYGLQVLRRFHTDYQELMQDYHEMLPLLEQAKVSKQAIKVLQQMEREMTEWEGIFDEIYAVAEGINPLSGRMPPEDPDALGGDPALGDPNAEESMDDMPLEDAPVDDGMDEAIEGPGEDLGQDGPDADDSVPADSDPDDDEQEEVTEEEVARGMGMKKSLGHKVTKIRAKLKGFCPGCKKSNCVCKGEKSHAKGPRCSAAAEALSRCGDGKLGKEKNEKNAECGGDLREDVQEQAHVNAPLNDEHKGHITTSRDLLMELGADGSVLTRAAQFKAYHYGETLSGIAKFLETATQKQLDGEGFEEKGFMDQSMHLQRQSDGSFRDVRKPRPKNPPDFTDSEVSTPGSQTPKAPIPLKPGQKPSGPVGHALYVEKRSLKDLDGMGAIGEETGGSDEAVAGVKAWHKTVGEAGSFMRDELANDAAFGNGARGKCLVHGKALEAILGGGLTEEEATNAGNEGSPDDNGGGSVAGETGMKSLFEEEERQQEELNGILTRMSQMIGS